ncbi:MAG: DUF6188 family protein [Dehalococcoidia bacterium]
MARRVGRQAPLASFDDRTIQLRGWVAVRATETRYPADISRGDYRLDLVAPDLQRRVGLDFHGCGPSCCWILLGGEPRNVEGSIANLDDIARFLGRSVEAAGWMPGGELRLKFDGGGALYVAPDRTFEAWEVQRGDGTMVFCMPGGEVTGFR